MSDNTKQGRWIVLLFINLQALYRDREDVFIAADLLWYPVEGNPERCNAPDVLVVFGRPKGDRGSYKQWEEDAIPVTVVFEILSPGNTHEEMVNKFSFYEEHGVEEYYIYDPDHNQLTVYRRQGEVLRRVRPVEGYVSPRLGIRFDLSGPELVVRRPDGQPFQTLEQAQAEREQERQQRLDAEKRAEQAEQRVLRLVELGRKARLGQASPEELTELERLEAGQ
jgi:Uma2 family endonuclease